MSIVDDGLFYIKETSPSNIFWLTCGERRGEAAHIFNFIVAFYLVDRSSAQIRVRLYGTTRIHGIPADFAEANDIITNLSTKREQNTFDTGMRGKS